MPFYISLDFYPSFRYVALCKLLPQHHLGKVMVNRKSSPLQLQFSHSVRISILCSYNSHISFEKYLLTMFLILLSSLVVVLFVDLTADGTILYSFHTPLDGCKIIRWWFDENTTYCTGNIIMFFHSSYVRIPKYSKFPAAMCHRDTPAGNIYFPTLTQGMPEAETLSGNVANRYPHRARCIGSPLARNLWGPQSYPHQK